jgi:hypothetical protein
MNRNTALTLGGLGAVVGSGIMLRKIHLQEKKFKGKLPKTWKEFWAGPKRSSKRSQRSKRSSKRSQRSKRSSRKRRKDFRIKKAKSENP